MKNFLTTIIISVPLTVSCTTPTSNTANKISDPSPGPTPSLASNVQCLPKVKAERIRVALTSQENVWLPGRSQGKVELIRVRFFGDDDEGTIVQNDKGQYVKRKEAIVVFDLGRLTMYGRLEFDNRSCSAGNVVRVFGLTSIFEQ